MGGDRVAVLDMLRKATADGDVDVLREGVRVLAEVITEAEVSELTGVVSPSTSTTHTLVHAAPTHRPAVGLASRLGG